MSSRLVALTARRAALQAECALQRDDAALAYADMPGLVQTAHLVFATILLSVLLLMRFDYAQEKKNA
jgi:hypothetical protein